MNCNVKITAEGTADGLEVSIHGGSVGMMTAAELIVARVLMAVNLPSQVDLEISDATSTGSR